MCLLFCFVIFWMLCYVMCEKKNVDNKKKIFKEMGNFGSQCLV